MKIHKFQFGGHVIQADNTRVATRPVLPRIVRRQPVYGDPHQAQLSPISSSELQRRENQRRQAQFYRDTYHMWQVDPTRPYPKTDQEMIGAFNYAGTQGAPIRTGLAVASGATALRTLGGTPVAPGGAFWTNPITQQVVKSTAGATAVNTASVGLTGNTWGQNLEEATGLPSWIGEFTNPGGLYGFTPRPAAVKPTGPVNSTLQRPQVTASTQLGKQANRDAVMQEVNAAVDDGTEYINRQLIPLAQKRGNWRGTNRITDDFGVVADVEEPGVGGSWTGGNVVVNATPRVNTPSTYVHEVRHMFDTDINTGSTQVDNAVIRFLRSDPTKGIKTQPVEKPIMITREQERILDEAYPTNFFDRFKTSGARQRTEKLSTNAENRKKLDMAFQREFGRKPSVDELDNYITNMDDEVFLKHIIKDANGYQDVYFDNMTTQYGIRNASGFTPMKNTPLYRAINWNRANYRVVDRSRVPYIKRAVIGVPMFGGLMYNINQ